MPATAAPNTDKMLEITPEHIAELGDANLRTLIGRLCEAELASRGLPVAGATWGGDQRAADGGLDVRVALPEGSPLGDFVPRPNTGFQVKRENMPPASIRAEMRPENIGRPVLEELADSAAPTSSSALRARPPIRACASAEMR